MTDLESNDFFEETLEVVRTRFNDEVQKRVQQQVNGNDTNPLKGDIQRILLRFTNSFTSGTIHLVTVIDGYEIWCTALHVTEAKNINEIIAKYGTCYTMIRRNSLDKPDVHFFTRSPDALKKFKSSCPTPSNAALLVGIEANTYNLDRELTPNVITSGFPHGVTMGLPQTRDLIPFSLANFPNFSDLIWLHSIGGPVVEGMSGGKVQLKNSDKSIGVLVVTAYFNPVREDMTATPVDFAGVQLFHNEMKIVQN